MDIIIIVISSNLYLFSRLGRA